MNLYQEKLFALKRNLPYHEELIKQVIHAKLYMDRHFADRLTLKTIASEAYYSHFHFLRLFRSIYGCTPWQYLKRARIDQAKQLLRKGHPVSDTCTLVGFESVHSFTSLFRKMTGYTPSAFARKNKQHAIPVTPLPYSQSLSK
jgi:AraC-like DNA-binding protein